MLKIYSVTPNENVIVSLQEALEWRFGQTWQITGNNLTAFISSKVLHENKKELEKGNFDFLQLSEMPDHADNEWHDKAGYFYITRLVGPYCYK